MVAAQRAGDAEPLPKDDKVLAAWALFHAGEFQKACEAGLKAGGAGITVANKAQAIYANYLEKSEKNRLAMFLEVSERAEAPMASTTASVLNSSNMRSILPLATAILETSGTTCGWN